jgi:uncharacterized protein YqjF (DUF2071 family)
VRTEVVTATCPRPVDRPVMLQGWHDLASVHWRYDPSDVQRLLPDGLRVDTCDGAAWVGLIPFHMRGIRIPGFPPFGRWSTFPETNVRTYVVAPDGRRAVWFFSLDISRLVPALVARATYGLPYCWGSTSITHDGPDVVTYRTIRRWPGPRADSRLVVRIGGRVRDGDQTGIERFVTARWALASRFAGLDLWADVDHPPWMLHRAELLECDDALVVAAGLPAPSGNPVVLWSPGVDVRIGRPTRRPATRGTPTARSEAGARRGPRVVDA